MVPRIAIVAHSAFHVLDLARELLELRQEVAFYSPIPRRKIEACGLPASSVRGLLPYVFPLAVAARRGPRPVRERFEFVFQRAVDVTAARLLKPCDVLIGMSGMSVTCLKQARRKFGAKIFLERGSRHILSQKEILEAIPGSSNDLVLEAMVERELWAYEFADVVVVPSRQVKRSFLERGFPAANLFRNQYGVDLEMFPPTDVPHLEIPTVIFVGNWSMRKGCDILWEACRSANAWDLLHVGLFGDAPIPDSPRFKHHDPVPRSELASYYRVAHVMALASREDGLSLVQAQALACGLPLVCTDRTGGEDLREFVTNADCITVVPSGDVQSLRLGIAKALALASEQRGRRDVLGERREELSWKAYGQRYLAEIERRLSVAA